MNEQKAIWPWVVVFALAVAVGLAAWWYFLSPDAVLNANNNGTATTTEQTPTRVVTENRPTSSVASIIANLSEDGAIFKGLFASTGVSASLTGAGPYTVFVPVDNAFANITESLNSMTNTEKRRLVQYHVVSGKMLDVDAVSSGKFTALSKDTINFNVDVDQGTAFVNSGLVIKQYRGSNGIVYLIGAVMVPPQTPTQNGNTGSIVPN